MCCLLNNDKAILVIIHPTDKGDSHAGITNKVLSVPDSPSNAEKKK